MMEIYKNSLRELRSKFGDRKHAYSEIFRVFHTLKGDSAYFPDLNELTNFTTFNCEQLRNLDDRDLENVDLFASVRMSFSRMSSILISLNSSGSIKGYRLNVPSITPYTSEITKDDTLLDKSEEIEIKYSEGNVSDLDRIENEPSQI